MPTKKLFGNAEILHNLPYEAISVTVDHENAKMKINYCRLYKHY